MLQRWIEDVTSRPDAEIVLLGVIAMLVGVYIWSATEVRRSRERQMRRIRDTLYISTTLLGQLTIQENRKGEPSEQEHHDLLKALVACKAASCLSPQLQDQIRDCIKEHDSARLTLVHRALERECSVLSDELSQSSQTDHWGKGLWAILRPAAEPTTLAATGFLFAHVVFQQRLIDVTLDSWENILPWIRAVSLMITIIYGYLLWASPRRTTPDTAIKLLSLLIALSSLLHLIGIAAAPYALALQLILFASGFGLNGTRSRSERPYAGHAELEDPPTEVTTETEAITPRKSSANNGE